MGALMAALAVAGAMFVSMDEVTNRSYLDTPEVRGWVANSLYENITGIPHGEQTYGEIPFYVTNSGEPGGKDFLYLNGKDWKSQEFPDTAEITVNASQAYQQLSLLHTGNCINHDGLNASIICTYSDGTSQTLELHRNRDISDWYFGIEGDNVRRAYTCPADTTIFCTFVSSFELLDKPLATIQFKVEDPSIRWMISGVTLSEEKLDLPEKTENTFKLTKRTLPPIEYPEDRGGESYRIIVLGDTHYDTDPEVYHSELVEEDPLIRKILNDEFTRNATAWKEQSPALMRSAARKLGDNTSLVIQLGDLIQGDCGSTDVHKKMLLDTLTAFKGYFGDVPFLSVVGNHDIRGVAGTDTAYYQAMREYLADEINVQDKNNGTWYFRMQNDLYLFVNFMSPNMGVIRKAFEDNADARYKFVVCHAPFIPSDIHGAVRWILYGNYLDFRKEAAELFLKNDVIFLAGHTHTFEFAECVTDEGRITQLILCSLWSHPDQKQINISANGPEEFGKFQRDHYKNKDGVEFISEFSDAITQYWCGSAVGYYVLDIGPDGVIARFYPGDADEPERELKLR